MIQDKQAETYLLWNKAFTVCRCVFIILIMFYIRILYILLIPSFIGATGLQSRPLKCIARLAVRKKKDYCLTDRLRVIQYSDSPVNYFYPLHVPSPAGVCSWCWVRRQESMKKGHQAIRYNRFHCYTSPEFSSVLFSILKCSCWTWPGQAWMLRLEHFHIKNVVSFKALWATGGIRRGCSSLLLLTLARQNICPISGSLNMHAAAVSAVAHTCRILFYLAKLCSCLTLNEKG